MEGVLGEGKAKVECCVVGKHNTQNQCCGEEAGSPAGKRHGRSPHSLLTLQIQTHTLS